MEAILRFFSLCIDVFFYSGHSCRISQQIADESFTLLL